MKNNRNQKGFSLVELIVVIAIMAVLVGVIAPAYLKHVNKTRLQKDISAIGEVVQAIKVAGAEEAIAEEIPIGDTGWHTYVKIGNEENGGTITTYTEGYPPVSDVLDLQTKLRELVGNSIEFSHDVLCNKGVVMEVKRDSDYKVHVLVETLNYYGEEEVQEAIKAAFPDSYYESASLKTEITWNEFKTSMQNLYETEYQKALAAAESNRTEIEKNAYETAYNTTYASTFFQTFSTKKAKAAATEAGNKAKETAVEDYAENQATATVVATGTQQLLTNKELQEGLSAAGYENISDLINSFKSN